MTDTAATFYDVIFFDGRISPLDEYRRVIRFLVGGVVIGLGTVASACALVTIVTVAAAWIINTALATNPNLHAKAPNSPAAIALANHYPTLASAANFIGSVRVSTVLADALTFEAKWARAMAPGSMEAVPLVPQHPVERASNVVLLHPNPLRPPQSRAKPEIAHALDSAHIAKLKPTAALASASEKRDTLQQAHNKSMALPDPDSRTAVYDITARAVYLPNGEKLEAHSGLGDELDDPQYVHVRMRGPTPPNVYDLTLREELFHGVRAIRLNPVDDGKMFGREGMLAHTYMLGPNGQSNGCVSFRDYPKFLQAFLSGDVDRLVVVPKLGNTSWRTVSAYRRPARRYADNNP
jgi:Tlde1 domain